MIQQDVEDVSVMDDCKVILKKCFQPTNHHRVKSPLGVKVDQYFVIHIKCEMITPEVIVKSVKHKNNSQKLPLHS